jgi:hypothetical protein
MFNQSAAAAFQPLQERETLVLLDNLMQTPDLFVQHFKQYVFQSVIKYISWPTSPPIYRFAAATIFAITYGHTITSADDPFVKLGKTFTGTWSFLQATDIYLADEAATLTTEAASAAASFVDFFPVLR